MISPKGIKYEQERLQNLRSYGILDTAIDRDFDNLTKLASAICETPIAIISLVDADRQWFKSRIGIKAFESPRDISFCTHAINEDDIFEIEDARRDERFSKNPFVIGPPHIRFYAGAPLVSPEGYNLGTMCVIDEKPRLLKDEQREALKILSRQAVELIQLRKLNRDLEFARKFLLDEQALVINRARRDTAGELATDVCHQINNPLAIIMGRAVVLENHLREVLPNDSFAMKEIEVIKETTDRVSSVLKALRLYSKNETPELTSIDPGELVENALTLFSNRISEAGILLSYEDCPHPRVWIHKVKVEDAFNEVILNALESLEEAQVKVLKIKCELHGAHYIIKVSDTGQGYSQEEEFRIFDSGHPAKRLHKARTLIREMKGDLKLVNPKNPTTFELSIPTKPF